MDAMPAAVLDLPREALMTVEPGWPWAPTLRSPRSDWGALTVIVAITLVRCLRMQ